MYGPKLNCFTEPDYGVPGNADTIGIITNDKTIKNNPDLVKKFTQATQKGYEYAYANPDDAAQILVDEAPDANLKPEFVKKSMQVIVDGQYWGDPAKIKDGSFVLGTNDFKGAQEYFDFLAEEDAYTDSHDKIIHEPRRPRTLPPTNSSASNFRYSEFESTQKCVLPMRKGRICVSTDKVIHSGSR